MSRSNAEQAEWNSYFEHSIEGRCECAGECPWRDIWAGVELHGSEGAD